MPLVPKVQLGHSNCVHHQVLIFRKLRTWAGFNSLVNKLDFEHVQGEAEKWQIWGIWRREMANLENLSQNLPYFVKKNRPF